MNLRALEPEARVVAPAGALLLLLVLFLDWHRTTVSVAGVVNVEAGSWGWAGWGLLAGVLALALLALRILRGRGGEAAEALLGCGMLAATTLAVFTGKASVATAAVGVEANQTTWGAWLGLAVALVVAGATLVPLLARVTHAPPAPASPGAA